jgi:dolichol-phosphate mannosyltransferase
MKSPPPTGIPLSLLSIVIPAKDEEGCVASTIEHLHVELKLRGVPHEIVVVDDGSTDQTWSILAEVQSRIPNVVMLQNGPPNGFGRAVIRGLDACNGDGVVIMMADESDDCRDVVRYWELLNEGWDCVFGSRFMKGGEVIDYPRFKLLLNRLANLFVRMIFNTELNDTTNAFKAYRKTVIDGNRPLIAPHFNLTVELPLKAMVRGFSWTTVPITWRNRRTGVPKLKIKEMGSRYFFICAYLWLEKYFSRGDYRREPMVRSESRPAATNKAPSS